MRTTLDNGLKIITVEDHSAPVVALMVWVRVGSGEERPDQAGMAHVFEHMLFKGTERRGVGEIARTVEAAGGNINAFTSFDATAYFITMASRDVATGIDVLADALQNSTFDPIELKREEQVVLEEIRRGNDSPGRALSRELFDLTYGAHPYRLPVIGTEESVLSFSRDGLLEFYDSWYVPNNMTFVVVGDVEPDAIVAQITDAFADAEPDATLTHERPVEPEPAGALTRVVPSDFQQTLIALAYKSTPFRHPDTAALDLLSAVLGGGEASRLYRNVQDSQRLVHSISASSYTPLDAGLFMVDAALDTEKVPAAVGSIAAEIARLRDFGPTQVELERARVNLLASEVHERETMQGQARKVGYFETLAGGLEWEKEYMEGLRRATIADLQRVAREYLAPERARLVAVLKQGEESEVSDALLLDAFVRGSDVDRGDYAVERVREGLWRYTLPNGLRILVQPSPSVPLVALRLSMLGGQLAESPDTQGLASFTAEMLDRGTDERSAAQLAADVEGIAGSLSGFSGRNSFGIYGQFLTESLDTGLDLFADVVLNPAFETEEIEKLRVERLAALERREDNLSSKAFELLNQALYEDHPYSFLTLGTEESVKGFDHDALAGFWQRYAQPSNAVLAIVGDVEPDAIVESIAAQLGDWSGPERVELPQRSRPAPPAAAKEVSVTKNKNQVHLVLGFQGLSVDDPDGPALEVLTQLLSGQGGRLFLELRDRQSLAYSVAAFSIEGVDPGQFAAYIASAPEKLDQARDGLSTELSRIVEGPIEPAELERARAYLIGSHAVSLQRFGSQASLLSLNELYGLGPDHHLTYEARIEAVTLEDVRRVARRVIDLERAVYAVVR